MAANVNLRSFDRSIRMARTIRACTLKLMLVPRMTVADAKAHLLQPLTYPYDPSDADEIVALHRAFEALPSGQGHLVAERGKIAIWKSK